MDKPALLAHIIQRLNADLQQAVQAAEAAHADATHEESVAENQYDTLGLEASYLAAGHSRRVLELREALLQGFGPLQQLALRLPEPGGEQLLALFGV